MAEENNVHIKLAGADVLGLFLISMIAILVGMYGLEVFDGLGVIINVSVAVGIGLFLCTIVSYLNENAICAAVFGLVGIFLIGFNAMVSGGDVTSQEIYTIFFGLALLLIGVVALYQPVRILPILLFIAGLSFIFLGLWFDMGEDIRAVVGVFWLITSLLALYMATAIGILTVKGKAVLPLLIKG